MGDNDRHSSVILQFAWGKYRTPSYGTSERAELRPELQKYIHLLGPTPKRCLEMFADLGLSDDEIGRYFRMPCRPVTELRAVWKIDVET